MNKIEFLEANLSNNNMNETEKLKEELNNLRKHKMQGILVRSRAQLLKMMKKLTKFFYNLEKHNHLSKIIPKLVMDDGKTITDQFEILNETIFL